MLFSLVYNAGYYLLDGKRDCQITFIMDHVDICKRFWQPQFRLKPHKNF